MWCSLPKNKLLEIICFVRPSGADGGGEGGGTRPPTMQGRLPVIESEAVPGAVGKQTPSVAPGKLPVIEGFFCKKNADKKQLQREIEALRSTDAMGREKKREQSYQ
jgi:hypothetical protein